MKTLGELIAYTEHDLRSFQKWEEQVLKKLKTILENYSLYLGMNLDQFNSEDNKKADHLQNKEWNEVSKHIDFRIN